jgi:hypothetical protein
MFGFAPFGAGTFDATNPPWRKIVETTAAITAEGNIVGVGNPMAQGRSAVTADGDVGTKAIAVVQTRADITAESKEVPKGVVVIESRTDITAEFNAAPTGAVVIESRSSITADALSDMRASPIAASSPNLSGMFDLNPVMAAISASAPNITGAAEFNVLASASESPPQLKVAAPDLQPLVASHEADDLEAELKALFKQMFDTYIRPDERYVNVLGMPQHGPRALVESSLAADGLAIYRGADTASGAGAYLLRAWRAKNPKRGRHLLETYLQLLWPNVWKADQMWQDTGEDYPTALATEQTEDHFLTSRIEVTLPARATTGGDANAIASGLRASLPARMVMKMSIVDESTFDAGITLRYYAGASVASFEGTFA